MAKIVSLNATIVIKLGSIKPPNKKIKKIRKGKV